MLLVIGANPAWQKCLTFTAFSAGGINRASSMEFYPAGKGANVCRALKCWNGKFSGRLLGIAAGENGRHMEAALAAESISFRSVWVPGNTRMCTTCLANGQMTEIIEPSTPIPADKIQEFLAAAKEELEHCAGMVISGSCPDGTAPDLYVGLAKLAAEMNKPLLVDTKDHTLDILMEYPKAIVKINAGELKDITKIHDIAEGIDGLSQRFPQAMYAITDEDRQAYLKVPEEMLISLQPPVLDCVVNPLGAGDTASAVFFCELLSSCQPKDAFQKALQAATDSCKNAMAGMM